MTIQAATPYLILSGKADEAIAHYTHALGARVEALQRFGDMMPDSPQDQRNLVMHAQLNFGNAVLMLSDGGPGEPVYVGGPVKIALMPDDLDEARRSFDALSESGTVFEPLSLAPWGAWFGSLEDKYGVRWMFNCMPATA